MSIMNILKVKDISVKRGSAQMKLKKCPVCSNRAWSGVYSAIPTKNGFNYYIRYRHRDLRRKSKLRSCYLRIDKKEEF